MGKRKAGSHRSTKFDVAIQEKNEYDKRYESDLSYGYYSSYLRTGKLPVEWYQHLIDVQKSIRGQFNRDSMEYEEYKKRYHSKITFSKYSTMKKEALLPAKWYIYLIESEKRIPNNFEAAYAEYLEYIKIYGEGITFYEYFEKKANAELEPDWFRFLIRLEKSIVMLLSTTTL